MTDPSAVAADGVHFYWRPGCGFSARLEHALERSGVPFVRHNIWDDEQAAATVRHHAGGNETVPTVVIGPVGLVNPSPSEVVDAMLRWTPDLVPEALRPS